MSEAEKMLGRKHYLRILLVGLITKTPFIGVSVAQQSRFYRVSSDGPPAGNVLSLEITDNMISLTWEPFGTGLYHVQYTEDLTAGTWSDVPSTTWPIAEEQWSGDDLSPSGITFWTEVSTVKIRPSDSLGSGRSIHIKAAKNEYEAFQVAVTAPAGLKNVDLLVSNLTGAGGTIGSENIRLYREAYMNVATPSNIEGETGLWPDALIPGTDVFFNERRNGFPFDVPAGESRAIWVDVFVPATTNTGSYTGNLTITASGEKPASVPIAVTVWDFALPSTSSLVSAFGFDGWEVLQGHYGSHDPYDQIVLLSKLYAQSGLMHRISLESAAGEDWSILPDPPTAPIEWTEFDANWGPFLDGIDLPYGLKGAKLTSMSIGTWGDTDQEKIAYWRHFASHFKEKGWFDRLFHYTYDEPNEAWEFDELKRRASLVKQADPDLRVLSTVDIKLGKEQDLIGVVDIWVPVINAIHDKTGGVCWNSEYAGNQRGDYDERLAAADELWWYQSCMSHGCDAFDSREECFSGWPSYMIDIPAVYNRIMEWQTFQYDISGELYFSTNHAYQFNDNGSNDPWNNVYYFAGNGDGTLFYPGRPDKIGGTHHIPIASIRLKMIREGMEDYEYMSLLRNLGEESFAKNEVSSIVTNTHTFSYDPRALYAAREKMAQRIVAALRRGPLALSQIKYWAYQIQDISRPGAVDELGNTHYDMLVLEPTRTDWSSDDKNFDTKGMVEKLKNTKASDGTHRKLIIAYIDIGEAEDWRWYWKWSKEWPQGEPRPADWPDYIVTHDPDGWEGNYPVAHWDDRWKDIIIYGRNQDSSPYGDYNSVLDEVIRDGFDGIYLDWVEGFENEEVMAEAQRQGKDSAVEMIQFIQEMRVYAEERNPDFIIIQQNAAALCDGHSELFSVIDAISQEAIWYDGSAFDDWNAADGYDFENDPGLVNYYIGYLDQYLGAGIPVFNCEYALEYASDAYSKSYSKGYVPYCTRRSLSRLTTTPPPTY